MFLIRHRHSLLRITFGKREIINSSYDWQCCYWFSRISKKFSLLEYDCSWSILVLLGDYCLTISMARLATVANQLIQCRSLNFDGLGRSFSCMYSRGAYIYLQVFESKPPPLSQNLQKPDLYSYFSCGEHHQLGVVRRFRIALRPLSSGAWYIWIYET